MSLDKSPKDSIKKVRFNNYSFVHLIPMYYEIENYQDLWWNELDRRKAVLLARIEIERLLLIHPNMTMKQIKYFLYQNTSIAYNPAFFLQDLGQT